MRITKHTFRNGVECKVCGLCKKNKALTQYHNCARSPDKLNYRCKKCAKEETHRYRINRTEEQKERDRKSRKRWAKKNPVKNKQLTLSAFKNWISKPGNREKHNERNKIANSKRYYKDVEKSRAYQRMLSKRRREKINKG